MPIAINLATYTLHKVEYLRLNMNIKLRLWHFGNLALHQALNVALPFDIPKLRLFDRHPRDDQRHGTPNNYHDLIPFACSTIHESQ